MSRPVSAVVRTTALAFAAAVGALSLAGCAVNAAQVDQPGQVAPAASSLTGLVHGGQFPVVGAAIQLYQVGTSGYNSNAVPLLTIPVITGAGGGFNITGLYTCTPGTYLYLTASGGDPGLGTGVNPNLAMMSAIGLCDNLKASSYIVINEVSTVAMAYALAQFAGGTTYGTTLGAQPGTSTTPPADNFATSSTNITGLANAMATAAVLANPASGTSPGYNSNGSAAAEWWQVNMIANMLGACINSNGGSPCTTLFNNVVASGPLPVDTIQAALYLAQTPFLPSTNLSNLYNSIPAAAPFQPYPKTLAAVTDLSIAILYTPLAGQFTISSYSLASNVVTFTTSPQTLTAGELVQLSNFPTSTFLNTSVTVSAAGLSTTSFQANLTHANATANEGGSGAIKLLMQPNGIAFDSAGNAWVGDQETSGTDPYNAAVTAAPYPAYLLQVTPTGNPIPAGSAAGTGIANYQISSFSTDGTTSTPIGSQYALTTAPSTYTNAGVFQPAVDTNNNVWFNDRQNGRIGFINGSGTTYSTSGIYRNGGNALDTGGKGAIAYNLNAGAAPVSIILDGANDVFVQSYGTVSSSTCANTWGANTGGLFGFTGGDPTKPFYGGTYGISSTSAGLMAIDPNVTDTISGAPIPGAPFLWTNNTLIYQSYTASTGTAGTQGCKTPLTSLGNSSSNYATPPVITNTGVTSIPDLPNQPTSGDGVHYAAAVQQVAFDKAGFSWFSNAGSIDVSGTIKAALTKALPNYGSAFTPAQAAASFTFTYFHNFDGIPDGGTPSPRAIAIDGGGNVWFNLSTAHYVSEASSNGAALSPTSTPGFFGSTCACTFPGSPSSSFARSLISLGPPAIDPSGNVWSGQGGSGGTGIYVLVGIAVPRAAPDSLALSQGKLANRP